MNQTILHYMVSSGTGQLPTRPSPGVLFLLERSGLMANFQYAKNKSIALLRLLTGLQQFFPPNYVCWFPISSSFSAYTALGSPTPIPTHG